MGRHPGAVERPGRRMDVAAALVPVALLLAMGWARRWVTEDAYIDLRVVEQLLAGHGPVFNAGERVEAYTSPLWLALLSAWTTAAGSPELGAMILGLLGSAAGLLFAQTGAAALTARLSSAGAAAPGAREPSRTLVLPLGAIVFAVVPAAWDFATSGLECGLGLAWLGGAFWLLARDGRATRATALVIGLGPLVRPDFALFSLGFAAALAVVLASAPGGPPRARSWLTHALAAAALPVAYEVFRLGYFAALVPNTALAKEAGAAWWGQGRYYLWDFVGTYALWLPVPAAAAWALGLLGRAARRGDRAAAALVLGPMLSALAHAAYVTRVGGDFMHGRFLLPSLFAFLLPVASVAMPRPPHGWRAAAFTACTVWAIVCALWLRVPYPNQGATGPHGIADERGFYADQLKFRNPVRAREWARNPGLVMFGQEVSRLGGMVALSGAHGLEAVTPLAPGRAAPAQTVIGLYNIGIMGYLAGPDVHVVDHLGLADPIAARISLAERGRPGHEKVLPRPWILARFGEVEAGRALSPDVADAAAALHCGDLARLMQAVEAPLTPARFLANIGAAWDLHRLRTPPDPAAARARFCGAGSRVEGGDTALPLADRPPSRAAATAGHPVVPPRAGAAAITADGSTTSPPGPPRSRPPPEEPAGWSAAVALPPRSHRPR